MAENLLFKDFPFNSFKERLDFVRYYNEHPKDIITFKDKKTGISRTFRIYSFNMDNVFIFVVFPYYPLYGVTNFKNLKTRYDKLSKKLFLKLKKLFKTSNLYPFVGIIKVADTYFKVFVEDKTKPVAIFLYPITKIH